MGDLGHNQPIFNVGGKDCIWFSGSYCMSRMYRPNFKKSKNGHDSVCYTFSQYLCVFIFLFIAHILSLISLFTEDSLFYSI